MAQTFEFACRSNEERQAYISASWHALSVIAKAKAKAGYKTRLFYSTLNL